jgi:hypothetical protein
MKKEGVLSAIIRAAIWLTGILVALAVGFGMIGGTLTIPWLNTIEANFITVWAGWIVVVLTVLGIILSIFDR